MSNHDITRAVSRFGPNDQAALWQPLISAILCSLRGTICLYQGEELGLTEADLAFEDLRDPYGIAFFPTYKGRDGCRTPMPWTAAAHAAGFTEGRPWLPVPVGHLEAAVDRQEADPASVLNRTRTFLKWRRAQPAMLTGDIRFLEAGTPLLALTRATAGQRLLCVFNLGAASAAFEAPGKVEPTHGSGFDSEVDGARITLPGYGAFFGTLGK